MKKLLVILFLFVSNVFAQEVPPAPSITQTYTLDTSPAQMSNIQQTGTPLYLGDDGLATVSLPFQYTFFGTSYSSATISQNGFLSFSNPGAGCCDGTILPNLLYPNSIFALWMDLNDVLNLGNPFTQTFNDRFVVGWYGIQEYGVPTNTFDAEITLFSNNNFSINYGNFSNSLTNHTLTAGYQGNTVDQIYQIYNGTNPFSTLSNSTFTFNSTITTPTVNCTLTPSDPSCITQNTNTETNTTTTTVTNNITVEEPVVDVQNTETTTTNNQEVLANSDVQTSNSLQSIDNNKEETLKDNIDKSVLQLVLSVTETSSTQTMTVKTTSLASSDSSSSSSSSDTTTEEVDVQGNMSDEIVANGVAMNNASNDELQSIINTSQVAINNEIIETTEDVSQPVVSNFFSEESEEVVSNKTFDDQSDSDLLASILDNAGLTQIATAQTYNSELSVADREMLGVFGKKEEDKSDAEKKAEQIVAANKEEQENIKNNYFDADQSGILGAMASDTDVTSYRSAMIPDNNVWYKPEEIYKNVTYKDNARSLYFLEKGSTDMYKKLVDGQYK